MNGGLTLQEVELRKQKAANLDAALEWLEGRFVSEDCMKLERILRKGLTPSIRTARGADATRASNAADADFGER